MSTPDFSRGGGFGTPEIKAELEEERHTRQRESAEREREARRAERETPRVPWYRRLFHRG